MPETPKPRRPAHPLARQPQPRPRQQRQPKRPLPEGDSFFTPGAGRLRKTVEQRTATLLAFLFQLPRWVVPVVMVVLLLVGFAVADWRGGLAVLPVLGFVVWLAYMSWPSLKAGGRLMRVALATFLLLVALTRFGVF
ncbi:DUF6703 family protein [Acrocarpospora catenulata]|uniref:DUF6703 family protein n=1 Tax=Acrocarpospora catenulata TaxID=2836182 RepID=UPI0027E0674D|nr:DUF6703 family protein [Acrocarpospora catenulata]